MESDVSLLAEVVPRDLRCFFTVVRGTTCRGPAEARLFLDDMILLGVGGYAQGNHV